MIGAKRLAAGALTLCLLGGSEIGASAATGGGTGPGGGNGGGITGVGSGAGTVNGKGDCGPGHVAVVSSMPYWGQVLNPPQADPPADTVGPDGKTFAQHLWPNYTIKGLGMNFIVDPATGMVYGPSWLEGYNKSLGEGWPPGFNGPFTDGTPTTAPGYDWFMKYSGDPVIGIGWGCYVGSLPTTSDTVPVNGNFNLSKGAGNATAVDVATAGLVFSPIDATPKTVCPLNLTATMTGGEYPTPARVDRNSPPTGCPASGVWHGTSQPTGTWRWFAYESPIAGSATGCTSGTGAYTWNWKPASYARPPAAATDLRAKCTSAPADSETFQQVTPAGSKLNVQLSQRWGYECIGAATAGGNNFSWRIFAGQTTTQTKNGYTWRFTCDPAFTQTYAASTPIPVEQLEAVGQG